MENTARRQAAVPQLDRPQRRRPGCEIVRFDAEARQLETPSENFNSELEALGRRCLAANGGRLTGSGREISIRFLTPMAILDCR